MATERQPLGKWLLDQALVLAAAGVMAALAAYVAYHGITAAVGVVIGSP